MLHAGQRLRVVLHAEVGHAAAPAAEVRHQRVVGVQHEACPAVELGHELRPAVGQQLELAVAVELVAEQVGEEQQARLHVARDAGSQASSTSKSPSWPRSRPASSSAVATPQDMFEPARLCTIGLPERSSAAAIMAAVVVLPFVADTSTEPASSSLDMRASARGEALSSTRPGAVVPPRAPDAATGGPREPGEEAGEPEHQDGAMTRRQRRSTRIMAGVAPIGSPSA